MKKKKILISLIIIIIVLGILSFGGIFAYKYYIDNTNREIKEKFYRYAFKNNFENIFESKSISKILEKINENHSYESTTKIEFNNNISNTYLDLNKLTLELKSESDKIDNNSILKFMYSNNEIFRFNFLYNNKYFGIKNDEILNNYVVIKKQNADQILEKIDSNFENLYKNSIDIIKNVDITQNSNNIYSNSNIDYKEIFKKYVRSTEYLDEGIAYIEQEGEKIETNIYSLTISKDELINIFNAISTKIINDENIIKSIKSDGKYLIEKNLIEEFESNLDFKNAVVEEEKNEVHAFRDTDATETSNTRETNYETDRIEENEILNKYSNIANNINEKINNFEEYEKIFNYIKYFYSIFSEIGVNESEDAIKENLNEIFKNLNDLLEERIDENSKIKIVTYISGNETIKTVILLGENIELDIDYINELSTKFTIVEKEGENYNGYSIYFFKNKSNILESNNIEIDIIKDTKIVDKIEMKITIEGTEGSKNYNNTFYLMYSGNEGSFSTTISNKLNFKNVDFERLNGDNSILLDNLEDDEFNYFINNINYRLQSVYNEKLSKMNLINTNSTDKILQNDRNENSEESVDEKENIKELLIQTVSNEMGVAINEGREYTIKNLKDLKIEGYEIQVSVSQDIAIININGYKFKIDKDFNLSE